VHCGQQVSGYLREILGSDQHHPYRWLLMIIPCIRCSSRATALLSYDHAAAEAYLDDASGDEPGYQGMLLCSPHAGRFTPPVGWEVIDRRAHGSLHAHSASAI
jgi:hypothetical protein